jgi:hypothetical protein
MDIFDEPRSAGIVDFHDYIKEYPDVIDRFLDGLKIVEVNRRAVSMLRGQSEEEFAGRSIARYWTVELVWGWRNPLPVPAHASAARAR